MSSPAVVFNPYLESECWEFMAGYDTAESYAAFATYRDLGPRNRTFATVANMHQRSLGTIARWASQTGWAERVQSYDVARNVAREEQLAARRTAHDAAWAERRAQLLERAERALELGIDRQLKRLEDGGTLKPNELTQLLREVMRWQNLANGDVTERIDDVQDLSKYSDEELAELARARAILDKGKKE